MKGPLLVRAWLDSKDVHTNGQPGDITTTLQWRTSMGEGNGCLKTKPSNF